MYTLAVFQVCTPSVKILFLTGKVVKNQEYFLGYWDEDKQAKLEASLGAGDKDKQTTYPRPMLIRDEKKIKINKNDDERTAKVEGFALPFVELVMDDGEQQFLFLVLFIDIIVKAQNSVDIGVPFT